MKSLLRARPAPNTRCLFRQQIDTIPVAPRKVVARMVPVTELCVKRGEEYLFWGVEHHSEQAVFRGQTTICYIPIDKCNRLPRGYWFDATEPCKTSRCR